MRSVGSAAIWSRLNWPDLLAPTGPLAVFDPGGREVPSQWHREGEKWRGCFVSSFPSLSFSLFDVRTSVAPAAPAASELSVGESFLENERLRVEIDAQGDICRIFDKRDGRELLAAPVGLEILDNFSDRFPVLGDPLGGHLASGAHPDRRSGPDDGRRERRGARRTDDSSAGPKARASCRRSLSLPAQPATTSPSTPRSTGAPTARCSRCAFRSRRRRSRRSSTREWASRAVPSRRRSSTRCRPSSGRRCARGPKPPAPAPPSPTTANTAGTIRPPTPCASPCCTPRASAGASAISRSRTSGTTRSGSRSLRSALASRLPTRCASPSGSTSRCAPSCRRRAGQRHRRPSARDRRASPFSRSTATLSRCRRSSSPRMETRSFCACARPPARAGRSRFAATCRRPAGARDRRLRAPARVDGCDAGAAVPRSEARREKLQ